MSSPLHAHATALSGDSPLQALVILSDGQRTMLRIAVEQLIKHQGEYWYELDKSPAIRALIDAEATDWRTCLVYLACLYGEGPEGTGGLGRVLREMLKRDDVLDGATAIEVMKVLVEHEYIKELDYPITRLVSQMEKLHKQGALVGHEEAMGSFLERNASFWKAGRDPRVLEAKLKKMLGGVQGLQLPLGESRFGWVDDLHADFATLPEAERETWMGLMNHALTGSGSSPSNAWLKAAAKLAAGLPADAFSQTLARWFAVICNYQFAPSDANEGAIKAMVWLAGVGEPKVLAPGLGDMAVAFYTKVQWHGPRSRLVGNACIQVLCLLDKPGVVQLSRLRSKVRYSQGKALIEKSVVKAAERAGLTPDDMEEASVPDMGFDAEGVARFSFGGATALLRLEGEGRLATEWSNAEGKVLKSAPAEAKRDNAEAFKEWQKGCKEFADAVLGQRTRFEQAYLRQRTWRFGDWYPRFIDSTELLGWMGRRLIWNIEHDGQQRSVIGLKGVLTGFDGTAVGELPADATVSLWHPIQAAAPEVLAWRELLQEAQVLQPIRQAFREVYLLTDAERESGTTSRRFAGHLLRQFQLAALLRERGWDYALQGSWDSHNTPCKTLKNWGLAVLFELDVKDEFSSIQGDTGVFAYVESGEFRFVKDGEAWDETRLADIPPLVFSEVLRDMDLFVGVCSVANDPELGLVDDPAFRGYISLASNAELQGGAQVRRDLLDNILSRLPIAKRCHLDGRYLVVKGDLRTYRIHLGSSNILMAPNDQYLCIVQDKKAKSASSGLYLPFEGDALLSLILSKALLLANDKKIKDPSILSQINA